MLLSLCDQYAPKVLARWTGAVHLCVCMYICMHVCMRSGIVHSFGKSVVKQTMQLTLHHKCTCVCVHVCIRVYICMYIYLFIYMYAFIYGKICMYVYVLCLYARVHVGTCERTCVFTHVVYKSRTSLINANANPKFYNTSSMCMRASV